MKNMNEIISYVYSLSLNELGIPKNLLLLLHKFGYYKVNDIKNLTINELSSILNIQIEKAYYLSSIIFEKCIYIEDLTRYFFDPENINCNQYIPYFNLIRKLFGNDFYGKIIISNLNKAIYSLNKRSSNIIILYFGLDGNNKKNIVELGKILKISKTRVQQIIQKALSRLRYITTVIQVSFIDEFNDNTNYIENLQLPSSVFLALKNANINTIQEFLALTREDIQKINGIGTKKYIQVLTVQNKLKKSLSTDKNDFYEKLNIGDLPLSNRAYHALRNANINTIYDFLALSKENIAKIHNIGSKTYNEILLVQANVLKRMFDEPKFEGVSNELIESLSLSTRAYNALKCANVNTVQELLILTPEEIYKLKNIGKKTLNEILLIRNTIKKK